MAEALGIAGSLAGLIALTAKVIATIKVLSSNWKEQQKDYLDILNQALDFKDIVKRLEGHLTKNRIR